MTTFHFRLATAAILLTAMCAPSLGGEADVVGVLVIKVPGGALRFDVTVRHDDSGWDHYADRFEIVGPDGNVLGTRVLLHPHETEQPFTRSASGIVVPEGVTTLRVRAHDSVHGFGGVEMIVAVPD